MSTKLKKKVKEKKIRAKDQGKLMFLSIKKTFFVEILQKVTLEIQP